MHVSFTHFNSSGAKVFSNFLFCVPASEIAEDDANLKASQNSTLYESRRFLKEIESEATFGRKETCRLNGSEIGHVPLTFPVNGGTGRWNAKVENVLTAHNDGRKTYSSRKEDHNGHLLYPQTCHDGNSDSFSSGSPSKRSQSEGVTKNSDPKDSMQKGEPESFIVSTLSIQESSTCCVLNLFLDSLDIEENKSTAPKEIPSRKSASENSVASSAESESESNEHVQARMTSYSDAIIETVERQSAESREMHEHKNAMIDRNSSTIPIQCTCKNQDSVNNDSQVIETLVTKHEHVKSGNESVTTLMQLDEGESSFSACSLIDFSRSIAYSGSLSLRSDCSATSARSFAFPILQSEWNRSPVRTAKADKRHFRKHRCWTSGTFSVVDSER